MLSTNPEFFRIDCLIGPFDEPRQINAHKFVPTYEHPLRPTVATGLYHMGPLTNEELGLYAGLEEHFPITRLGADELTAYEANKALEQSRKDEYLAKARERQAQAGTVATDAGRVDFSSLANKPKGQTPTPAIASAPAPAAPAVDVAAIAKAAAEQAAAQASAAATAAAQQAQAAQLAAAGFSSLDALIAAHAAATAPKADGEKQTGEANTGSGEEAADKAPPPPAAKGAAKAK